VLLGPGATPGVSRPRICSQSALLLSVSGAAVSVGTNDDATRMTVCCSDDGVRSIENLQFSLGEGPSVDVFVTDQAITEPDLARAPLGRWPGFGPTALALGVAAVFGFPLRAGGTRIGTLNLYRDQPGVLSSDQFADALVAAELIAGRFVSLHAGAGVGTVADEVADESRLRLVVHQATGMIAAQLGVTFAKPKACSPNEPS
jgi:GAF domain-containing protein